MVRWLIKDCFLNKEIIFTKIEMSRDLRGTSILGTSYSSEVRLKGNEKRALNT